MDTTTTILVTTAARAAAFWCGASLLVLLALAALVVRQRAKHKVMLGDNGVEELTRAGRVFGNATEYVPAGMAALAVLALVNAPYQLIHVVGAMLVVGRIAHAFGLGRSSGTSPGRAVGILLTWLAFLLAGLALIYYAL